VNHPSTQNDGNEKGTKSPQKSTKNSRTQKDITVNCLSTQNEENEKGTESPQKSTKNSRTQKDSAANANLPDVNETATNLPDASRSKNKSTKSPQKPPTIHVHKKTVQFNTNPRTRQLQQKTTM
jgi:hypothetical protein